MTKKHEFGLKVSANLMKFLGTRFPGSTNISRTPRENCQAQLLQQLQKIKGGKGEEIFKVQQRKIFFNDVPCRNPSSRCHGGQTDYCCENQLGEKVKCLT